MGSGLDALSKRYSLTSADGWYSGGCTTGSALRGEEGSDEETPEAEEQHSDCRGMGGWRGRGKGGYCCVSSSEDESRWENVFSLLGAS
jgi:hypothetical protein